jgi:hypothetical protein
MTAPLDTDSAVVEVHRFHDALASWLDAGDPADFEAIERAWAPDFTLINLDGAVVDRARLVAGLAGRGGTRPGLRIAIDEVGVLLRAPDAVVVTFRERHEHVGEATTRRTTAVLVADPSRAGMLLWSHVHETGITS